MTPVDLSDLEYARDTLDAVLTYLIETGLTDEQIRQVVGARLEYARNGQPYLRLVGDDG